MVYREGIRHRIGRGISLFHTLIGWDYPEHINNQQSSSLLDQVSSICDQQRCKYHTCYHLGVSSGQDTSWEN
jgi:hypothetical protein